MPNAALLLYSLLNPHLGAVTTPGRDLLILLIGSGVAVAMLVMVGIGSVMRLGLHRRLGPAAQHSVRPAEGWGVFAPSVCEGRLANPSGRGCDVADLRHCKTHATIMFTDVVGFSAAMDRDEAGTLRALALDLDLIRRSCAAHTGRVLKTVGDGVLVIFERSSDAVRCAQEIQGLLSVRGHDSAVGTHLQHRIGIHAGEVYRFAGEVMGAAVNIAARLEKEAPAGGICLSQTVIDSSGTVIAGGAHYRGTPHLRNISVRVPLYLVSSGASRPVAPVIDLCARATLGQGSPTEAVTPVRLTA